MFGAQMVGAIRPPAHGLGSQCGRPVVVNYMREYQLGLGIPREQFIDHVHLGRHAGGGPDLQLTGQTLMPNGL
jgi:hypothetical protein